MSNTALRLAPREPDIHEQARRARAELESMRASTAKLQAEADSAAVAFAIDPKGKDASGERLSIVKLETEQVAANARKALDERAAELQAVFTEAQRATWQHELSVLRERTAVAKGGIPIALRSQHERLDTLIATFQRDLKGCVVALLEAVGATNSDRAQARELAERLRTGESFEAITVARVVEAVQDARRANIVSADMTHDDAFRFAVVLGSYNQHDDSVSLTMNFILDRSFQ